MDSHEGYPPGERDSKNSDMIVNKNLPREIDSNSEGNHPGDRDSKSDKNLLREIDSNSEGNHPGDRDSKSEMYATIQSVNYNNKNHLPFVSVARLEQSVFHQLGQNQNVESPKSRPRRKTKDEIQLEQWEYVRALLESKEENLEVRDTCEKGRGVYALAPYKKGDYIVEYRGELIDAVEAKRRNEIYEKSEKNVGSYMMDFKYSGKWFCIDATEESPFKGRLLNHSRKQANAKKELVEVAKNQPRIIIRAKKDIAVGQEIVYDYGDKTKASLKANPWLNE